MTNKEEDSLAIYFLNWSIEYGLYEIKPGRWISRAMWEFGHQETYSIEELLDKCKQERNEKQISRETPIV